MKFNPWAREYCTLTDAFTYAEEREEFFSGPRFNMVMDGVNKPVAHAIYNVIQFLVIENLEEKIFKDDQTYF